MYVHIRHFVKAHFQRQKHSPVHFKTHEHDFQPASLNKILDTRIFSASTSPVLSLCVIMNVCIKQKTKPPKILKFYRILDWNWHHLQIFISTFSYNTDIKLRSDHHEPVVSGLWKNSFLGICCLSTKGSMPFQCLRAGTVLVYSLFTLT